jgi:hypothetical protein
MSDRLLSKQTSVSAEQISSANLNDKSFQNAVGSLSFGFSLRLLRRGDGGVAWLGALLGYPRQFSIPKE